VPYLLKRVINVQRVTCVTNDEDEDEDELKLNSAQHARSAASRLDDVIDRSALEQAREGLGGRDIEEPLIGLEVQKEHS
jgi:hypothetical protein